MTDDKLIELAKQAGFKTGGVVIRTIHSSGAWVGINNELERFAQLVRNEVIEECAIKSWSCGMDWHMRRNNTDVREVGSAIANEIRSMKS